MNRIPPILKSKTVWGAVFAAGGYLVSQQQISISEIVAAVGIILGGVGIKDNFVKVQSGEPVEGSEAAK